MDAKWTVRSVILGAALALAVVGAPAAAGEGIRVVEVPGDREGCTSVRVLNSSAVVVEFLSVTVVEDEDWPIRATYCYGLGDVLPSDTGVYFEVLQTWDPSGLPEHYPLTLWVHTDGTPDGTSIVLSYWSWDENAFHPVVYRGRLYGSLPSRTYGREMWSARPRARGAIQNHGILRLLKDIRPGRGGSGVHKLHVQDGLLRFRANDGRGYRWWVSDGTRKGTHVVKR